MTDDKTSQKGQNVILNEVIRLAKRAKESFVLDIGINKDDEGTPKISYINALTGEEVMKSSFDLDDADKIQCIELADGSIKGTNVILTHTSKQPESFNGTRHGSLPKYVDALIDEFNECETKVLNKMSLEEETNRIANELDSLTID